MKHLQMHLESLVFFRSGQGAAYLVYGGAAGFQGIAFKQSALVVGTLTAAASSGVAYFTDLGIKKAQIDYRFQFESDGLLQTLGSAFSVVPGPAVELFLLTKAGDARGGEAFITQAQIGLLDKGGNLASKGNGLIVINVDLKTLQNKTLVAQLRGRREAVVQNGVATPILQSTLWAPIFCSLIVRRRRRPST